MPPCSQNRPPSNHIPLPVPVARPLDLLRNHRVHLGAQYRVHTRLVATAQGLEPRHHVGVSSAQVQLGLPRLYRKCNARLRVVFDNGTEGQNLLRSLATELYKDPNGRRVMDPDAGPLFTESVEDGDTQTGLIYVVKSMSDDPKIRELDGTLFKIGFTAGAMEVRIQNAKDDPTFLMAPVRPVKTYP